MNQRSGWLDGLPDVRRVLKEAHTNRHRTGRDATKLRKAEIERLRESGEEARATRLEEIASKKSTQFMRLKRQAEEREAERELKKLGAVLRREDRKAFKRQPPDRLFIQFEAQARAKDGRLRDLYYDWIGRGLGSGKKRDYARAKKRTSSRTTPWKSGEMGRKIRYIFRGGALEEVEGNALTNMGDDIVEAVACSRLLEDLEQLGRSKNGGVYHHVILALPHHLSGPQRAELLNELTQPLREMKLPFCAALHKPDTQGDERNYHAHVVLSLRPMDRMGEYHWEFAPSKRTWLNTTAGLRLQRRFVARSFNRALTRAGIDTRWTHKSRATRGEASPGNTKKGPEGTREDRNIEAAGRRANESQVLLDAIVADEHALIRLEHVEDILERTEPVVEALVGRVVSELKQLADICEQTIAKSEPAESILARAEERDLQRKQLPPQEEVESIEQPNQVEILPHADPEQVHLDDEMRRRERRRNSEERLRRIEAHGAGVRAMLFTEGQDPGEQWFEQLRDAVIDGKLCAVRRDNRTEALLARDQTLLAKLDRSLELPKMKAYMRAVSGGLPPAPADQTGWFALTFTRKEAQSTDRNLDDGIDVKTQQDYLKGRGLSGR